MKSLKSYTNNVFQPAERRLKNFTISLLGVNANNPPPLAYGPNLMSLESKG